LELVKLERHGGRYPRQLSGGQQQRIALARAIVFRPRLLLMDEPLGALDKKLREALQLEILRIARQLEATVVYVTHDQEEALTMSDRIAIFQSGRIAQIGRGDDLYDRPASLFVADFIGESNILRGRFEAGPNGGHLRRGEWTWRLPVGAAERAGLSDGAPAALVIRPERAQLFAADDDWDGDWNATSARIREVLYLGATRKYELVLEDGQAAVVRSQVSGSGDGRADGSANGSWASGDRVKVRWSIADGIVVPDTTAGEAVGSGGEREIESV
jgi:putative spermidine/putrescine transport system ATP-binding protein